MPKSIKITYKIAHAAGRDEGNRSMRKAGRKAWNHQDYNKAAKTMNHLLGNIMPILAVEHR